MYFYIKASKLFLCESCLSPIKFLPFWQKKYKGIQVISTLSGALAKDGKIIFLETSTMSFLRTSPIIENVMLLLVLCDW